MYNLIRFLINNKASIAFLEPQENEVELWTNVIQKCYAKDTDHKIVIGDENCGKFKNDTINYCFSSVPLRLSTRFDVWYNLREGTVVFDKNKNIGYGHMPEPTIQKLAKRAGVAPYTIKKGLLNLIELKEQSEYKTDDLLKIFFAKSMASIYIETLDDKSSPRKFIDTFLANINPTTQVLVLSKVDRNRLKGKEISILTDWYAQQAIAGTYTSTSTILVPVYDKKTAQQMPKNTNFRYITVGKEPPVEHVTVTMRSDRVIRFKCKECTIALNGNDVCLEGNKIKFFDIYTNKTNQAIANLLKKRM